MHYRIYSQQRLNQVLLAARLQGIPTEVVKGIRAVQFRGGYFGGPPLKMLKMLELHIEAKYKGIGQYRTSNRHRAPSKEVTNWNIRCWCGHKS